jgi:hypothetical protein
MRHQMSDHATERPRRARRWRLACATFLVLGTLLGSATSSIVWASHQFNDVPSSNPFHDDIDWLTDNEITEGFSDGTFRPNGNVTRGAMAAFLHRQSDATRTVVDSVDFTSETVVTGQVACPAGTRLIGGGSTVVANGAMDMEASGPIFGQWAARHTSFVPRSGTLAIMATCMPG